MARSDLQQRLMRRVVDGLAGWATFHQAHSPVAHYDEHLFYEPIRAIAEGRKWSAKQQQAIAGKTKRLGAPESVDFVIFRKAGAQAKRSSLVFMEVKLFRGKNPTQDIKNLRADINKLRKLNANDIACYASIDGCGPPARFLLIIARGDALDATIRRRSKGHGSVVEMLREARDENPKVVYRSRAKTYLKADHQWRVIAIGSPRWPK